MGGSTDHLYCRPPSEQEQLYPGARPFTKTGPPISFLTAALRRARTARAVVGSIFSGFFRMQRAGGGGKGARGPYSLVAWPRVRRGGGDVAPGVGTNWNAIVVTALRERFEGPITGTGDLGGDRFRDARAVHRPRC